MALIELMQQRRALTMRLVNPLGQVFLTNQAVVAERGSNLQGIAQLTKIAGPAIGAKQALRPGFEPIVRLVATPDIDEQFVQQRIEIAAFA